jgi:tetratricopeptide (TPR) repeat protein
MASSYHQLGIVEQSRQRPSKAQKLYLKASELLEEVGDPTKTANSYHQLGTLEQQQGRPDTAEQLYLQAIGLQGETGDLLGTARSYHQLGMVQQDRGELDKAEQYYLQSIVISEQLQSRSMMAHNYGQLGLLAEAREHDLEALKWMIRCVTVFDGFPHPATGPGPQHLARLAAKLGIDSLEADWRDITGTPLPRAVREFVSVPDDSGEDAGSHDA